MAFKDAETRNAYNRQWSANNRESRAASSKKWRDNNPDYMRDYAKANKDRRLANNRVWQSNNRDKLRGYTLKVKYGITGEEYQKLLQDQSGVCAACGKEETALDRYAKPKSLAVDHNHKSGAIRGLLCSRCNSALGLLKEDAQTIRSLATYIETNDV